MDEPVGPTNQQTYASLLADAVRVFSAAARFRWPVSGAGGGRAEPVDWAEFVTLALAGAAANIGHVEAVLAGRPGSWEAEELRKLLISTVGDDDRQLLRHRTEPVVIDVYVDELLLDAGAWTVYDQAAEELNRREVALCVYTEGPVAPGQERECDAIGDPDDRLEALRLADWAKYGKALRAYIEAAAGELVELTVPVVVHVDVDTSRPYGQREGYSDFTTLGEELVEAAVKATPMPGDGADPLRRLETTIGPSDGEGS